MSWKERLFGLILSGVLFPILCTLSTQASGISSSTFLNNFFIYQIHHLRIQNHLHGHRRSLDKASFRTALNRHIFWLDKKTQFWRLPMSFRIHWETPSLYLFEIWLFVLALESNSIALEPVPLCQICSHYKLIYQFYHTGKLSILWQFWCWCFHP